MQLTIIQFCETCVYFCFSEGSCIW